MRLRKLTLTNVRRFANQSVELGPFGDGLTTITAENETGKSTFFDALHALFFFDSGSARTEVRSLQPYSGGAMTIVAEVDIADVGYRIEKVFNPRKSGASATIVNVASGAIMKQADEAEAWIEEKVLNSCKGPAGLLWVRQGMTGVDPDGRGEADGVKARRDVMSSVRGQIDAITGGQKMDKIVLACRQELEAMATKQGKAKKGSPWWEAEDRLATLMEQRDALEAKVAALGDDLDEKKRVSARLRALKDPDLRAERKATLDTMAEKLTLAKDHAQKVRETEKDRQLLRNDEQEADRHINAITRLQGKRQSLAAEIITQKQTVSEAENQKSQAHGDVESLQREISEKVKQHAILTEQLNAARRTERIHEKHQRLLEIDGALAALVQPTKRLSALHRQLQAVEIKQSDLDHLADLERRRDMALEKRKVHFSHFTLYGQGRSATVDGAELEDGQSHLIDQPMDITLPGFGLMQLRPAEGGNLGIEDPDALQKELDARLRLLDVDSVQAARHGYETRRNALVEQKGLHQQIKAWAPLGVDALTQDRRQLCQALGFAVDGPIPPIPPLPQTASAEGAAGQGIEKLETDQADSNQTLVILRAREPQLRETYTQSVGQLAEANAVLRGLKEEEKAVAANQDETETLSRLRALKAEKSQQLAEKQAYLDVLIQEAPDLPLAEAAFQRAQQAETEDGKEIQRLEKMLAHLNGAIQSKSEEAVEETLAEVVGKLSRAEQRVAQFSSHAKALKLLIGHLEAARADAQETYFEPIRKELLPLLQQLHGGIDFQIDADKLLIESVTRQGVTDKVDVLSGGAYEQIAILTRLAFARLFAKQGSHVPIILDDALVHTDDERISTMFNMLAQVAKNQQIIVLSCRTRAFSDLGGERAFIRQAK